MAGDLTKPDGHVVQWGVNDFGRLVKLQPAWTRVQRCSEAGAAWMEDSLDHRSLVAATAAITGSDELSSFAGQWLEAHLARALACGRRVPVGSAAPIISVINEELDFELFLREIECLPRKIAGVSSSRCPPAAYLTTFSAPFTPTSDITCSGDLDDLPWVVAVISGPRDL